MQIAAYRLTRTAICPPDSQYFREYSCRQPSGQKNLRGWRLSAAESLTCFARFFVVLTRSLLAALAGVFHVCVQFVTLIESLCLNYVNLQNVSLAVTEKEAQGGSKTSVHSSLVMPEASSRKAKFSVCHTGCERNTRHLQLIWRQWITHGRRQKKTPQDTTAFAKCLLWFCFSSSHFQRTKKKNFDRAQLRQDDETDSHNTHCKHTQPQNPSRSTKNINTYVCIMYT